MGNGFATPSQGDFGWLNDALDRIQVRLAELETPSGTSVNSLVTQVQQAIANINTTVAEAISANSYTKTQIDTKVAAPGAITPTTVVSSGDVTVGGKLFDVDATTYNVTGSRTAVWVDLTNGRFGNTLSSVRFKQDVEDAVIDPLKVLAVVPKLFHYIDEVRKRDDPDFEEYVGPDYVVADEYGVMAEDLHAAGLTPWVYYDAEDRPLAVDYTMLVVPLLAVVRHLAAEATALHTTVTDLVARVTALEEGS